MTVKDITTYCDEKGYKVQVQDCPDYTLIRIKKVMDIELVEGKAKIAGKYYGDLDIVQDMIFKKMYDANIPPPKDYMMKWPC